MALNDHTGKTGLIALLFVICFLPALSGCEKRGEVKPLWIAQLPFHFLDSYKVENGVIVAFGAEQEIYSEADSVPGTLIALDSKTGNKLWQSQIAAAGRYLKQGTLKSESFVVVAAGYVFYRDQKNVLHALDTQTGAPRWQANDVLAILTIAESQVFVVNGAKKLAALTLTSGVEQRVINLKWKNEIISCTRLLVADGREYLAVDGNVTATERSSGKQLWTTSLTHETVELLAVQGLLVLTNYRTFTVFDGATGRKLWQYDSEEEATLPNIDGDVAYTGLEAAGEYTPDGGFIRGFKLATGEKVSEVKSGGMVANGLIYDNEWVNHYDFVSRSLVDGGYRWRESSDVRLIAKDPKTGRKVWTADPWNWGWIEKRSVTDGVVYAAHAAVMASAPVRLLAYRAQR